MHICPVCGYPQLAEPPRSPSGGGSYEICPSCGFQFGVDDDDRGKTYAGARKAWQEAGTPWSSKGISVPKGWNGSRQLLALTPARKAAKKSPPKPAAKVAKSAKKVAKAAAKKVAKKPAKKATASHAKKPVQSAKKKARNRR